jgi:tetratricopeptide (TPR) repeat protein
VVRGGKLRICREFAPVLGRLRPAASVIALVVGLSLAAPPPALAATGTVVATEMNGFGRIVLTFDKAVRAQVRTSNGVVILSFDEQVTADLEKLAAQAPRYVAVARRDPDGRSIRIATPQAFRANLMEAGERLFLDLLPAGWQGLPPALPADVVEELARRARQAEDEVRRTQRERLRREPRDMAARVATGPTFTRLVLDAGQTVPVDIRREGDTLRLRFDAALRLDAAALKSRLPESVLSLAGDLENGTLNVTLEAKAGTEMRAFREDDAVIVDFPRPVTTAPERSARSARSPAVRQIPTAPPAPPAEATPAPESPRAREAAAPAAPAAPPPQRPIRAVAERQPGKVSVTAADGGIRVEVPSPAGTPAAAFMRGEVAWLVFHGLEGLEAPPVPVALKDEVRKIEVDRVAGGQIVRLTLSAPRPLTLAQAQGGWTAMLGGQPAGPIEPLTLRATVSQEGRTVLATRMPGAGQVMWIEDPDTEDRLAIVTAQGPAHGVARTQAFVEVVAHPTVHGLALHPRVDDVVVQPGLDQVVVGRERGLTLSPAAPERAGEDGAPAGLLLETAAWADAGKGDIRARGAELLRETAEAPKRQRSEARARLALFLLANGRPGEASAVLRVMEDEDAVAASTKPWALMKLMAMTLANRHADMARAFATSPVRSEPEAMLWKAHADAGLRRWTDALVGFRQTLDIVDRYPEEVQVSLRRRIVEAAIEMQEPTFAQQQLDALERLEPRGRESGQSLVLRGRIAAMLGRPDEALAAFETARRSGDRPVEAAARLHGALVGLAEGTVSRADAMAELETVGMIWRRDEIEVTALARLGELYAEDGRWREAFATARRATEVLPDHPLTRRLHDEMARRFEDLFLDGRADELPRVEAVGLFFDFRHLLPISRRGDEIIRRLADRLASLDLLDQAAELLQHQVDNRLGGLQKARIATRLAVIYLSNRKPVEALQALKASRLNDLPEDLRRARLLVEARALSEISRNDVALDILAGLDGPDVERLRAEVLWRSKRWREAGEALEQVLGDSWQGPADLDPARRGMALRAGIAYILGDDRLGADRLRSKFAGKMAASEDARAFQLVTSQSRARPGEFRALARQAVSGDTLAAFLDAYRERYPDLAGPESRPEAPAEAMAEMRRARDGLPPRQAAEAEGAAPRTP